MADVLVWLRDDNPGHTDKVRFVGVEYYLLGSLAYDAVDRHVAATAPGRLAELRRHLRAIRPSTANLFRYIQWYLSVADKGPYVGHARQVYELVKGLPHRPGDRAHALALHHARQIVSFYVHYRIRTRVGNAGDFTGRTAVSPRVPSHPHPVPIIARDVHKRACR